MIQVGLIGAGGIGEAHSSAYALIPEAKVCAVVDVRTERAELLANRHEARAYTSLEAMLAVESPDMVDICTPSFTHKMIAIECLKRGLHVLCEKPIAMTLNDAEEMVAVATQRRRKFMIAQVIRFWPEYLFLKQVFEKGTYGQLLQLSFSRTCGAPVWAWEGWYMDPQRSGRAPFELGIHDLDFVNFMLGKPDNVSAVAIERPELNFSYLHTHLKYLVGLRVETEAAWYAGPVPFKASFRAVFEKSVLEYKDDALLLYRSEATEAEKIDMAAGVLLDSNINLENAGPIHTEIAYFIDCLVNDRFPKVITPKDSLDSLKLLFYVLNAAQSGQTVKVY